MWYIGWDSVNSTHRASGNKGVIVDSNGTYRNAAGGYSENAAADENNLTIDAFGMVKGSVYGGYTTGGISVSANNNELTIQGQVGEDRDHGGYAYGGYSPNSSANGNTVTIDGGIAYSSVYGGYAGFRTAEGNHVIIKSGQVCSNVYGGITEAAPP